MADPYKLVPIDNPFAGQSNQLVAPEGYTLTPIAPDQAPPRETTPADIQAAIDTPNTYAAADVPGEAMTNFLPSLGKQLKEMYEGVTGIIDDPIKAAKSLNDLGISMSPLGPLLFAAGNLLPQLPEGVQKVLKPVLDDLNAPRSAIQQDLVKHYGGWDEVKRTMAEDPARVLMDASNIFSGGATAAARVPKLAKALDVAATATDPISLAAAGTSKVAAPLLTAKVGVNSGVGSAPLNEAFRSGYAGGETGVNFRRAFREGVPTEEIINAAEQGVKNIKDRMMSIYDARKNDPNFGWVNDPQAVNFAPISRAWKDVVDSLTTKSGMRKVGDAEWNQIQKVGEVVAEWEKNPALRSVDDIDGLKQRIQAIYPDGEAPQLRRVVTKMAGAARQALFNVPGYKRAMKDYAEASDSLAELKAAFALNDKASMQTQMSKLQSVMRNNANTQYGHRTAELDKLEREGGVELRPQLAGSALNSWEPRGLARVGVTNVPEMAAGFGLLGPLGVGAGYAWGLGSSVPKVAGGAYHGAGRLAGAPDALARFLPQGMRPSPGYAYKPFTREPRGLYRYLGYGQEGEPEEHKGGGYFRSRSDR